MVEPTGEELPIEALSEAIARVSANGQLHACNVRMRELLAHMLPAMATPGVDDLPLTDASAQRLQAGDEVVIMGPAGPWQCRVVTNGNQRWLLASEHRWQQRALAAELAAARVRTLGGMASAILHDLANLLVAGVGLAEAVRSLVRDEMDAKAIDELSRGARQGTLLGRALAAQLNRGPRGWERVRLAHMLGDVLAMVRKNAAQRGIAVSSNLKDAVMIRVQPDEAVQALLHGMLFCLENGASGIEVSCGATISRIAEGRERRTGHVRIEAAGVQGSCRQQASELLAVGPDLLRALDAATASGSGLAHAAIAVTRAGGSLTVASPQSALAFDYVWPAVRA